jgi:hypothetical protein
MKKLERGLWMCVLLAAVGGCSSGGDAGGRSPGFGGPRGPTGTAGSRSGSGAFGDGLAGSGLAPIVKPGVGTTPVTSDPNTCASASVRASRITPTVYLVIDGSSSMEAAFGNGNRWSVLREALVGTNGVVPKLETLVNFGMTIYSNNDPMKCPAMVEVKPALKNFMPISAGYPAMETGGGTPTGEALQHVVDSLPDFTAVGPDQMASAPPIIVLATDGEPNGCASGVICNWVDWANCLGQLLGSLAAAPATYDTTLAAARAAKAKGISLWVVSLADGLNNIPDLQKTANIGAGLADNASPGATIYSPKNPDELTGTLTKLIGDVVSCNVQLEGSVVAARACEGTVTMNGTPIDCGGTEGWKIIDEKHFELQGKACERFKTDPAVTLDARFPCDVIAPQ